MSESIGGFKDVGDYLKESLGARSYGKALLAAAMADERIVVLQADLTQPTETYLIRDQLPDRFFMLGIQEANMVGVAGGMARSGDVAFAHSFCVFITRRVYDQVAIQAAYPKLNVKLVGFMPGLTTPLGVTHQAIDDIALMRALPNMAVIEPAGPEQIGAAVRASLDYDGPVYLRLPIADGKPDESVPLMPLELGKGLVLREGADVAILACGMMVQEALTAADELAARGVSATVANLASLKPLDHGLVESLARRHRAVVTAENHSVIGGLGSAVAETLALAGVATRFGMVGVADVFAEGGTTPYLMQRYGLTAGHIRDKALGLLKTA
ncbi:MAG: transketolase family protein [Caulobacterales bacterium]